MQQIDEEEQRRRLEEFRRQGRSSDDGDADAARQRDILLEYRQTQASPMGEQRSATQQLQDPSVLNESWLRPGIQATTPAGAAGELAFDVGASAATGGVRGLVTAPQLPLAAANLAARGYSSVADLFREKEDRGQYEPPLPTRNDFLTGARNIGLIDEAMQFYEPQTPLGRIFEMGAGGAAEGFGVGGAISTGRMALSRGRRTFDATGRRSIARDTVGEGVSGLLGGGLAGATMEFTDNPALSLGAGMLGGYAGARSVFSNSRAEQMVRDRTSDINPEDFDRAREIAAAADELGIPITPIEALAVASGGGADDLSILARNVMGVTPQGGTARREMVRRTQAGESVEQAFQAQLESARAGAEPLSTDQAATQLIDLSQRLVREQRQARSAAVRAERDALRGASVDASLVNRVDQQLASSIENLSPNSPVYQAVTKLRLQLRNGKTLDSSLNLNADNLDEFFDLYYATVNASDFRRTIGDDRLAVRVNERVSELDRRFTTEVPERAAFRSAYRAASPPVTQVETMLGGIGSASDRELARRTIERLVSLRPGEAAGDLSQLRGGFDIIAREDPRLAGEILAQHMELVFSRNMREAVDSRRPINSPARFRQALFGESQNRTAIMMMFNSLDTHRGLTPGTTGRAFQNFMDVLASTGQVDAQRPNIGSARSEARQARGLSGVLQAAGRTSLVAPFYAVSSAWQRATGENTYLELARLFTGGGTPGQDVAKYIDEIEAMAAAAPRSPNALIAAGALLGARQGEPLPEDQDPLQQPQ